MTSDSRERLDTVLAEVECLDAKWGLCGNAGGLRGGGLAFSITDPKNTNARVGGPFPVRCESLDENFIVVRASANLALSSDCQGFHFYGTDLCVIADILGSSAYVIDFHLEHLSSGNDGPVFQENREMLIRKYRRALRHRLISTTCTTLALTSSVPLVVLAKSGKGVLLWQWVLLKSEAVAKYLRHNSVRTGRPGQTVTPSGLRHLGSNLDVDPDHPAAA